MPFWRSLRRSRPNAAAHAIYEAVVSQARRPEFFAEFGVPDTLDGRFEMIVIHTHLVLRRLSAAGSGPEAAALSQEVFDLMFADMDQSLREMGVGDLSVGRKVRAMAEAFYGRANAYDAGLGTNPAALASALRRNLYGTVQPEDSAVEAMATYVRRTDMRLREQETSALLHGRVDFAPEIVTGAA